jgi:hypothetical protein
MGGDSEGDLGNNEKDNMCPIDTCSGVCLHVFVSSPQDMGDGSHESAKEKGKGKGIDLREGEGVDRGWAESLGIVVSNLFCLCPFTHA